MSTDFDASLDKLKDNAFRTGATAMRAEIARYLQSVGHRELSLRVLELTPVTIEATEARLKDAGIL